MLGLESAVAVAKKHAHCVIICIKDDVRYAVAVYITDDRRSWKITSGVGMLGLECAIAVAKQHTHRVPWHINTTASD